MRRTLIAANWKMNMLRGEARELTRSFISNLSEVEYDFDIVLAPPYTAIDVVYDIVKDTNIMVGAQNVFWEKSGAFTGEISSEMLLDAGCEWVIIGHSERRLLLDETDDMVKRKIESAIEHGLNVIVCLGETLEEREAGKTIKNVTGQVQSALNDAKIDDPLRVVIAYEPIWAIGTGKVATPDEAEYVHGAIREITGSIFGVDGAEKMRIIYGGSVTEDNIGELLSEPNVDGALIGGASLKPNSMAKIVKIAGE